MFCNTCFVFGYILTPLQASAAANPLFGSTCCLQGDVELEPFRPLPQFLRNLLHQPGPEANEFRAKLREYNSAFAFTSIKCKTTNRGVVGGGPMDFQIHGTLFHRTGPLENRTHAVPDGFAQLYFHDPAFATDLRVAFFDGLRMSILTNLTKYLHEHNPFIPIYLTARERFRHMGGPGRILLNPQMRLIVEEGADQRRENLPTVSEVAVVIPYETPETPYRDIVLAERDNNGALRDFHTIHPQHAAYLPLAYPLIFPHGDKGYHWNIRLRDNRNTGRRNERLGWRQYCRYILHTRVNHSPDVPFSFKRVFQQFLVDLWAAGDQQKLYWLRNHQKQLRADLYNGVQDWLGEADGDHPGHDYGHRIILPASYVGGERFVAQAYQDSMAIVRALNYPALFITATANPNWQEIVRELLPGQTASDRPDIVGRVFNMKCDSIMKEIKGGLFGKFMSTVWTIEYQKRGLPHRHILIFLSPEDVTRHRDPRNIDNIIRAEIPTAAEDPTGELRAIVTKMMIHRPCGTDNPTSACMKDCPDGSKKCSKKFPKDFRDATIVPEDGYPLYRRRDTGETVAYKVGNREILLDNRFVVPYNPYLSKKYTSHINVEICATVKAVKYIHKYIYKGSDRATVQIRQNGPRDEIEMHLQGRYVSPAEAVVQLFEFPVHEEYPPVMRLSVHLEGQQPVYFPENASSQEIREIAERRRTELMAFFEYNAAHPDGRHILYVDFPRYYTFLPKTREWRPRQRGISIGRVFYVPPTAGGKHYLRLLLSAIPGPQSFEHLRTIEGTTHPTFRAACLAAGLLEDDNRWVSCFTDAAVWQTGYALRRLFVTALLHGDVVSPITLWEQFAEKICDDLPHKIRARIDVPPNLPSPHIDYGLFLIHELLSEWEKRLEDFGLPAFQHTWTAHRPNPFLEHELSYNQEEQRQLCEDIYLQFNEKQRLFYDEFLSLASTDPKKAQFFVQGPGGTGKTFLYKGLAAHFRSQGKVVLCVASSGIAALLLPGGRTAHSRFKIPLDLHSSSTCSVPRNSKTAELIRRTSVIIWDEVPMQHRYCFEAVDRTLRDILRNDELFGGVPTIFGGDFAQILPVVRKGQRPHIVSACL